ncbi:MAG: 4'-phosphopantetheinyl transferase superfamily protein [Muribaculaceae bacterium]|nr:4'-phosphopantetheinyl transferase superfamily protein [Muribaculaceae bacterium]
MNVHRIELAGVTVWWTALGRPFSCVLSHCAAPTDKVIHPTRREAENEAVRNLMGAAFGEGATKHHRADGSPYVSLPDGTVRDCTISHCPVAAALAVASPIPTASTAACGASLSEAPVAVAPASCGAGLSEAPVAAAQASCGAGLSEVARAALSAHDGIGVDIEAIDRAGQLARVAARVLSTEELECYSDRLVEAWTLKEALYKAAHSPGLDFRSAIHLPAAAREKATSKTHHYAAAREKTAPESTGATTQAIARVAGTAYTTYTIPLPDAILSIALRLREQS